MNRSENPRYAALAILRQVTENGAYCNLELKKWRNSVGEERFGFLSALCYGALEHLMEIDTILTEYCHRDPRPAVKCILRLGVCELLYMSTPVHAVVSEYVSLCREVGKSGLTGFVNAVLRKISREKSAGSPDPLPHETDNCPEWILRMWESYLGKEETLRLLSAGKTGTTVRAQHPWTTEMLRSSLPVPSRQGNLDPNALILSRGFDYSQFIPFSEGHMAIQGEGAMMVCRALGDCTDRSVLDACAAPGGKSAYLASLFKNRLSLTCWELHDHRIELMKKTFRRLHVEADVSKQDACTPVPGMTERFDAVLLDVPCSGLGLFHEKPDIRYSKSPEDIATLTVLQKAILDTCSGYVKKGGILVYATCTISPEENEGRIRSFLANHTDFLPDPLPFDPDHYMTRFLPHLHGTDGFFVARLKRCS